MSTRHMELDPRRPREFVVVLRHHVATPAGVGRLIAPRTLVVQQSAVAALAHLTSHQFENLPLGFDLDRPGGLDDSENEDNWGVLSSGFDAKRFWDLGATGKGVRIGIADSGIDATHPTFAPLISDHRLTAFAAFGSNGAKAVQHDANGAVIADASAVPTFTHWHGTFTSAILVGSATLGKARGMAPGAQLAVAQVLQQANNGTVASIYGGLRWLADQKCDVVSLSLGWDGKHDEWADPVQSLVAQGVVVVAASGNSFGIVGSPPSDSPANYPLDSGGPGLGLLISVGSIDNQEAVADDSGSENADWSHVVDRLSDGSTQPSTFVSSPVRSVPTMVGPGVGIVSARPGSAPGKYRLESGTSMATPHVAGLIALVLELIRKSKPASTACAAANLVLNSLTPLQPAAEHGRSGRGTVNLDQLFHLIGSFGEG